MKSTKRGHLPAYTDDTRTNSQEKSIVTSYLLSIAEQLQATPCSALLPIMLEFIRG